MMHPDHRVEGERERNGERVYRWVRVDDCRVCILVSPNASKDEIEAAGRVRLSEIRAM